MHKIVIAVCKCAFKINNKDITFANDKIRCSHKEVTCKYVANSQNNFPEVSSQ